MRQRSRILAVFGLVVAASASAAAQVPVIPPDARMVYISGARISSESAPGKAGQARVQALQQTRASELRTRQQTLEATRKQLVSATTADERTRLVAQESTQRVDAERFAQQAQLDIQNLQREISNELRQKLNAVLGPLLKGTRVETVLNLDTSVVWSVPGLDISTVVIERLNAAEAAASTPAAPAPGAAAPATPPRP